MVKQAFLANGIVSGNEAKVGKILSRTELMALSRNEVVFSTCNSVFQEICQTDQTLLCTKFHNFEVFSEEIIMFTFRPCVFC